MLTWPVASGSLLVGFAVAAATGIRPLGAIVMIAAVAWCARRWLRAAGLGRTVALVLVYVAAFVLSHLIADTLSAWPSVLLAATVTGLAVWALADAAHGRAGAPV
ncbi:MAG: hypothetical protein QOF69_1795 [Solirubrobacteraceae bacterium]|jgi:hypothetical protein|nr:hypothetical protein [Solirubrobacteraceae bacterium]